jgi:two-component sensor histidine kinase/ligand-binding sensor domain-containing protein
MEVESKGSVFSKTTPVKMKIVPSRNREMIKAILPGKITGLNGIYDYLDIEQGLPTGLILTLYQDKKGNIWIGTSAEGVVKYDDTNFYQYTGLDGLANNWVRAIIEDSKGNMWFGTDGGLVKYDGTNFYWMVDMGNKQGNEQRLDIRSLEEDKNGDIWIGTAKKGLFRYNDKGLTNYMIRSDTDYSVSDIMFDKQGNLWFSGLGIGACKLSGTGISNYTTMEGLIGNNVNCIAEDGDGNLWFGTTEGVSKFDHNNFYNYTKAEGLCHNDISSILVDRKGNIWFGSRAAGCTRLDGNTFYQYNLMEGFRSNIISCLLQDNAENTLIGTEGGGIMIMKNNLFMNFGRQSAINQSSIRSISEDRDGNTWFGSFDGTLLKFDGHIFRSYPSIEGINGKPINSIIRDKQDHIWFGGLGGGLYRYDGKIFTNYDENTYPWLKQIMKLYEDKKGNIWIGTNTNGIIKFDGISFTNILLTKTEKHPTVWSIFEDVDGNMWFGIHNGLLVKYDGKSFLYHDLKDSPLYNILEDSESNIWVASTTGGIFKYDKKNNESNRDQSVFLNFRKISEKFNTRINSLIMDQRQKLWIGTNKGLVRFENPNFQKGNAPIFHPFTLNDGLSDNTFVRQSVFKDSRNNIWWGTTQGVNLLKATKSAPNATAPTTTLNQITIKDQYIDFHHLSDSLTGSTLAPIFKQIKTSGAESFSNNPKRPFIPYELNQISFHYSAMDWSAPHKIQYSFMVEGLDKKWSQLTSNTTPTYRNLPYGNFIFKVKAIGSNQVWGPVLAYPFSIIRPWWHTWLFRTLALLTLLGAIWLLIRHRTKTLLKRQAFLQRTVEKRTAQLSDALGEKEALLKEMHHRVKNNLEVISSLLMLQTKSMTDTKAKAALAEGQSRVQSIALIHHKLYKTNDLSTIEIKDFASDLFKQVKDVFDNPDQQIKFEISGDHAQINTDTAVPLGLILNELFTNSFKYGLTQGKVNIFSLQVNKYHKNENVQYELIYRDSGPGLPSGVRMEEKDSLGMKIIHLLIKQLNGSIHYFNKGGAVFEISFTGQSSILNEAKN